MPNSENLKGKGFDARTTSELRRISQKGGQKSGEARRKKTKLKKTLNAILQGEVYVEELAPFLESVGLDNTAESALCAALIARGIKTGDPKCFEVIAKYAGQSAKSDLDIEGQQAKVDLAKEKVKAEKRAAEKTSQEENDKGIEIELTITEDWQE